jgi:hypothetical protein
MSGRSGAGPALLVAVAATGVGLVGLLGACNRPLFDRALPAIERVNPNIPGGRFQVLASIAGGDARIDFQVSVTVRQQLQDSGFTVVRRAGRWDSQTEAVRILCEPPVNGVLFIWYNRLELRDCVTEGGMAYEITSRGQEGITHLTDRLIRYLRSPAPPAPSQ